MAVVTQIEHKKEETVKSQSDVKWEKIAYNGDYVPKVGDHIYYSEGLNNLNGYYQGGDGGDYYTLSHDIEGLHPFVTINRDTNLMVYRQTSDPCDLSRID